MSASAMYRPRVSCAYRSRDCGTDSNPCFRRIFVGSSLAVSRAVEVLAGSTEGGERHCTVGDPKLREMMTRQA